MHDPAYKLLFSRPRMVRDLLDGFAARGWSGALDFDTLDPLPASFVSEDLQQRHGDLVWRIRFRDDRWLYLVLLLEFQATVDPAMALRMLTYTALLYQRLDADGVLRDHGALPPVLPVVLYNGRRPWTASVEMTDLVAAGSDLLAPYQPSQRYYLLDGVRVADADLPADNLVSVLIGLEKTRDAARLREVLRALSDLLRAQGDDHLTQAFVTWLRQGLRFAGPLPSGEGNPLTQLQETQTMLEENVREWTRELLEQGRAQGVEEGRAQGIEQGRHEERALLCRQAGAEVRCRRGRGAGRRPRRRHRPRSPRAGRRLDHRVRHGVRVARPRPRRRRVGRLRRRWYGPVGRGIGVERCSERGRGCTIQTAKRRSTAHRQPRQGRRPTPPHGNTSGVTSWWTSSTSRGRHRMWLLRRRPTGLRLTSSASASTISVKPATASCSRFP